MTQDAVIWELAIILILLIIAVIYFAHKCDMKDSETEYDDEIILDLTGEILRQGELIESLQKQLDEDSWNKEKYKACQEDRLKEKRMANNQTEYIIEEHNNLRTQIYELKKLNTRLAKELKTIKP